MPCRRPPQAGAVPRAPVRRCRAGSPGPDAWWAGVVARAPGAGTRRVRATISLPRVPTRPRILVTMWKPSGAAEVKNAGPRHGPRYRCQAEYRVVGGPAWCGRQAEGPAVGRFAVPVSGGTPGRGRAGAVPVSGGTPGRWEYPRCAVVTRSARPRQGPGRGRQAERASSAGRSPGAQPVSPRASRNPVRPTSRDLAAAGVIPSIISSSDASRRLRSSCR